MQEIHPIGGGGGGGRFFGGGADRRLRPHNHPNHHALKCPRCDSLNTKFCYYNNYNLSQPRHFCKSCRRYWTKGGVLRNVPVGGGCRKAKRSKPKTASSDAPAERKSNSHSSSESSSLTASTTAATTTASTAAAAATPEVASASCSTSAPTLLNFPNSMFFNIPQTTNLNFDQPLINHSSDGGIFPEIGSFTSMMTSSNDPSPMGYDIVDISASAYRLQQHNHGSGPEDPNPPEQWPKQQKISSTTMPDGLKMQEITTGFMDQTVQIELSALQNRGNNGGLGTLDWQGDGDHGLYDLTGTVDQAYWSQAQWTDNDNPLYLP